MIGRLKGDVAELKPTELLLDVNGVGFELSIPLSTYEKIQGESSITILVHTIHKEDQFKLFGFHSKTERDLFRSLINVSGIGPAMALAVLSGISPEMLTEAVKTQNPVLLTKIPGIGKTKAEKIVFELKRKISLLEKITGPIDEKPSKSGDAVEALVALGFDETRSFKCVSEIVREKGDIGVEGIIKEALKLLA